MKLAILVTAALAAGAFAASPAHADPQHRGARLRARFDINRDGRLEPEERIAMRSYAYARLVRRFDLDHDGRLGPGEVPPRVAARLQRFDRNGDGWIEPGEMIFPARRARNLARPPAPPEE